MNEFEKEVAERVASAPRNKELQSSARDFLLATIAARYSYNFSWQGRPIIQYPQDIAAMQELIWRTRPPANLRPESDRYRYRYPATQQGSH